MIQFNLLPTVKLDYVKARRNKRVTMLISALVSATMLTILVLLFFAVQILQKKHSEDLSKDIKQQTSQLKSIPDLDKILTIQNQLNSLSALHDQKPDTIRLFTYLKQITPAKVSIATLNLTFDSSAAINISGSADTISTINKFVDTLKFTTYKTTDGKEANAFSKVVLASFGTDDKGASYQINFVFDPIIFSNTTQVTLTVPPGKITTRSETEKPEALFQPLSNSSGAKQ